MTGTGRVIIVGLGALGSHLMLLARNWPETLQGADFDSIEVKNMRSQFHTKMGIGKKKSVALQTILNGLFGVKVDSIPHKLVPDNVSSILDHPRLVIDCTDNPEARNLIQGHCRKENIPCLHGCLSADGKFGRVVWSENFKADDVDPNIPTCENEDRVAFYSLVTSYLVLTAREFLDNGRKHNFNITPWSLKAF